MFIFSKFKTSTLSKVEKGGKNGQLCIKEKISEALLLTCRRGASEASTHLLQVNHLGCKIDCK